MARERLTPAQKRARTILDKQIEAIYYQHCSGVQINVFDIGKVFTAGREAAHAGESIEAAVLASVAALRVN